MFRAALWSVLGMVVGMASSQANAQYFYSPVGYYGSPVVRPIYSAPIPVGLSYYAPAPVIVSRPVYTPIIQTVYSAPVSYISAAPTISYSNYEPTPIALDTVYEAPAPVYIAPAPVYVTAAPVVVSHSIYSPAIVRESLRVGPFSSTYRSHTYGLGYGVHSRATPHRSITRIRGW